MQLDRYDRQILELLQQDGRISNQDLAARIALSPSACPRRVRALGESAPLLLVGAFSYVSSLPKGPMDSFIALPIQIYTWMSKPSAEFKDVTAAAILVLMALLLLLNAAAIIIRAKFQKSFE